VLFSPDLPPLIGMRFFERWTIRPYWLGRVCQVTMIMVPHVLYLILGSLGIFILLLPLTLLQFAFVYILYIILMLILLYGGVYIALSSILLVESLRAW
jgi:hypothetical protein